jgi:hypothetical protein
MTRKNVGWMPDRRFLLAGLGGAAALSLSGPPLLRQALAGLVPEGQPLKPGDYTWTPEKSPGGSVAIVVSIPDQRVEVLRGGKIIAVSTCSTGKPGHGTPTGTFTILEKAKVHHSSIYNNAPMPNMERLTWGGIALHAGKLPGYPASHGCVRLPLEFSALLFTVTHVGTTVTITESHIATPEIQHRGMVLAKHHESEDPEVASALKGKAHPALDHRANPTPPVALLVSSADMRVELIEDAKVIASGPATIADPQTPLGSHAFILGGGGEKGGLTWHVISHSGKPGAIVSPADADLLRRIGGDPRVIQEMKTRMHPGMVLVTTDDPMGRETRTSAGFTIIATEEVG